MTTGPATVVAVSGADVVASFDIFDQYAVRFLATRKSEKTQAVYGRAMALYRAHCVTFWLDPLRLDAVISFSVAQNALRGEKSDGTIAIRLRAVQSFLSWCYVMGLTQITPEQVGMSINVPPARKLSPKDILTEGEVERLLAAASPGRETLLLRVMLDGGLRVSEALGLTVGNIYAASDRYYLAVVGKGDKQRDVEIPRNLFLALREYTDGKRNDAKVFKKTDRTSAWRIVGQVVVRARIDKKISPHSLRHTHAHHMRMAGMALEVLADRMGHSSVDTTKTYTRPAEMAAATAMPALPWQSEA